MTLYLLLNQVLVIIPRAGSIASHFQNNRPIESYRSEPVHIYILKFKINVENSELSPFCRLGQLKIINFTMYLKY